MKWLWSRHQNEEPEPEPQQPEPEPEPPLGLFGLNVPDVQEFGLEEQIVATANVMAVRDASNMFLAIVKEHRDDGHDCPPYCVPTQLAYFLGIMNSNDLRMMLTVLIKDMVDTYLQQAEE